RLGSWGRRATYGAGTRGIGIQRGTKRGAQGGKALCGRLCCIGCSQGGAAEANFGGDEPYLVNTGVAGLQQENSRILVCPLDGIEEEITRIVNDRASLVDLDAL